MRSIVLSILLFLTCSAQGQELAIGIMRDYTVSTLEIDHHEGNYAIYGDSTLITNLWKDQKILFKRNGEKIKVVKSDKTLGFFERIEIREMQAGNALRIQCLLPVSKKSRKYRNDFVLIPEGDKGIKVVNHVEMENYLGGVIESEGGGGKHLEYYKVQAILSRTYALGHLRKHRKEGFQLCDRVHCQAYHNMLIHTSTIKDAVEATKGVVMLDRHLKLAQGYFFANCGGQTSEADFVWNTPVSHCKSVVDPFCTDSWQANWTKRIDANKWKNYLVEQFGYPVNDSIYGPLIYHFKQPMRHAFYLYPQVGIPLRDLRMHFKLKSTWFSIHKEGNEVVLTGKGFGHGVGLCQEGAMGMSRKNYTAKQILNFYFTEILLMNYFDWNFFRQNDNLEALDL